MDVRRIQVNVASVAVDSPPSLRLKLGKLVMQSECPINAPSERVDLAPDATTTPQPHHTASVTAHLQSPPRRAPASKLACVRVSYRQRSLPESRGSPPPGPARRGEKPFCRTRLSPSAATLPASTAFSRMNPYLERPTCIPTFPKQSDNLSF